MSDQNEAPFDGRKYLAEFFGGVLYNYNANLFKDEVEPTGYELADEVLKDHILVKLPEPRPRWSGEDGYPAHNVESRGDAEVFFDEDGRIAWTSVPLPLRNADAAEGFALALLAGAREWRRRNGESQ